jgi:hypothetical protein
MTAREMQRRSAKARWSGKTAEARRREMSALAKARWAKTVRKPKRAARLPNGELKHDEPGRVDCK